MNGLIAYGSLIHRQEIKNAGILSRQFYPIILHGYKRSFAQEPTWRRTTGIERAVLTITKEKNSYINAILLLGLRDEDMKVFDEREKGYDRKSVNWEDIKFYSQNEFSYDYEIFIYLGKPGNFNNQIMPNPKYLNICLSGAKMWGTNFYNDFLETTYIKDRRLLDMENNS